MKLNFGRKLVLFLHWLLSLIACALAVGLCVWPDRVQDGFRWLYDLTGKGKADIIGIVLLALYLLLTVWSVIILFSGGRRGERRFITVDSSDAGRTRIAVGAVDQMIRQAVRGVDGITEMKSSIINSGDSISINANIAIAKGVHVPTVTMNVQRAIRSYIELNCGVAVREVCVSVHSVDSAEETAQRGRRRGGAEKSFTPETTAAPTVAVQQPDAEVPLTNEVPAQEAPAAEDAIQLTLDPPEPTEANPAPEAQEGASDEDDEEIE